MMLHALIYIINSKSTNMLADTNNVEILCAESMIDTVPVSLDSPTAMEDIKAEEERITSQKQKRVTSPFLTPVTKLSDGFQITNQSYCGENFFESL